MSRRRSLGTLAVVTREVVFIGIGIVGVPIDLGANRRGTDMGPSAIRNARLLPLLKELFDDVVDYGNVEVPGPEQCDVGDPRVRYLQAIGPVWQRTAAAVARVIEDGRLPVVLGGDHSLAVGTAEGAAQQHGEIGMIYFDAHGDFNDPTTTMSGNVHGMPVSVITGCAPDELMQFTSQPVVDPARTVLIGIRDLDKQEREKLRHSEVTVFSMKEIDELGMAAITLQAIDIASRGSESGKFHVSFDMDAIDPMVAMGVGTPVPGGLTYREAHLALELIAATGGLCSLEMVEVNPILDRENRTAELAVGLIQSATGKTII